MPKDNHRPSRKRILLALQGGGAHSAYAWGVVDRLLENDDIEIVAVSGTSGGALIAAVLAYGLSCTEGDDAARRAHTRRLLRRFWTSVAAIGDWTGNPYRFVATPLHPMWNIDGMPVPVALNALSLLTSPYQRVFGLRQNPVSMALNDCIDFNALRDSRGGPALYVCATNVRTCQSQIFRKHALGVEHLLASACLPMVDRAVRIGEEYYWDGGYVADPALPPLIRHHKRETRDLVIVGVNPIVMESHAVPPDTAWEIIDRMNEITFNTSMIAEIKRIHEINGLLRALQDHAAARAACKTLHGKEEILVHYIPPHADMAGFGVASKSNTALRFLEHLHALGREVAAAWENGRIDGGGMPLLGVSSDTNLERLFIDPHRADAPPLPEPVQGARTMPGADPARQHAVVEPVMA